VLGGADALMLSAEASVGTYPVDAVATMARIIEAAEQDWPFAPPASAPATTGAAIARAAGAVGATALVAFTMIGERAGGAHCTPPPASIDSSSRLRWTISQPSGHDDAASTGSSLTSGRHGHCERQFRCSDG
jgi:hypothetical protein